MPGDRGQKESKGGKGGQGSISVGAGSKDVSMTEFTGADEDASTRAMLSSRNSYSQSQRSGNSSHPSNKSAGKQKQK